MKKSRVMKLRYEEKWGDIIVNKVALFDERDYPTDKDVIDIIKEGYKNNNDIVIMDQSVFETVFRSMF